MHKVLEVGKPNKDGYYLTKYFNSDESNLPSWGVFYYRIATEDNPEREGFYFEPICNPIQNVEKELYNHKVFEWEFLPNLRSQTGEY